MYRHELSVNTRGDYLEVGVSEVEVIFSTFFSTLIANIFQTWILISEVIKENVSFKYLAYMYEVIVIEMHLQFT